MTSSTYNTINNALTIGTIISIVVGSVIGFVVLIGAIIFIICIIKHLNRSKNIGRQGRILQPAQTYPYPQSWSNQYPSNITSVANYPPTDPPYIASAPNYFSPANM
jgi:hypothetical protein